MEELMETKEQNGSQGELFNEICVENISAKETQTSSLKETNKQVTINFDKFLIFLILLIISISIAYAFGVATGRGTLKHDGGEQPSLHKMKSEPVLFELSEDEHYVQKEGVQTQAQDDITAVAITEITQELPEKGWTIQVVTYKDYSNAHNEVAKLRDEGFNPFIIPSGKYYQVCVNAFTSRSDALKMLSVFTTERQYFDAFVRKIKRS